MADATIPVDLFNPGQVFACLGFLEAADILFGAAEGGFDWSDGTTTNFNLCANGDTNPIESVLAFLSNAEIRAHCPVGYDATEPDSEDEAEEAVDDEGGSGKDQSALPEISSVFPANDGDKTTLPVQIVSADGHDRIELSHWIDGSRRNTFKLYSGNRSAFGIANAMLKGTRKKPSKKQRENEQPGDLKTKGIIQLYSEGKDALVRNPFGLLTPMGGSFNFDPRGAWTAIDSGYSPNDQKDAVEASPVVELLAAIGLQHSRPIEYGLREVRYAVWSILLTPMLARAALTGGIPSILSRSFHFTLALSGKNKVVTFSQEEI